jgi:BMFP domain-containing protein YqiC
MVEERLAALEARTSTLEARLRELEQTPTRGQTPHPNPR